MRSIRSVSKTRTRLKKPAGYRRILTVENAKTSKGEKLGFLTGILYFAPHKLSGYNVCINARNCIAPCLNLAGHGGMTRNQLIRIEKTRLYFENPELFLACLRYDIARLIRRARNMRFGRRRMKPAVRINGTSDLPKIVFAVLAEFPEVQFYDYTKHPKPHVRTRANYHLTFSYDGPHNEPDCLDALTHGINVAVVFNARKGQPLPETWNGYPVIDGDLHDLRFMDPIGVVVGLRPKGPAKKAIGTNPFVVLANQAPACGTATAA